MKLYLHTDGFYHCEFTDQEQRLQDINTGESDRAKAEKLIASARVGELEQAAKVMRLTSEAVTRIVAGKRITLNEALDAWRTSMEHTGKSVRTIGNNHGYAKLWLTELGISELTPSSVTEKHVGWWVNDPTSGLKAGTRAVRLSAIRSFFEFMIHNGWAMKNIPQLVSVDYSKMSHDQKEVKGKETFTDDEFEVALAHCGSGFYHDAMLIGRDIGLRLDDICSLEWASVLFDQHKLVVWTGKADVRVELPMTKRVERALRRQVGNDRRWVFPEQHATYSRPSSRGAISTQFKRIFARAGFESRSFHCLRATYATVEYMKSLRSGHDERALAEVAAKVGHQGTAVTKRYVNFNTK